MKRLAPVLLAALAGRAHAGEDADVWRAVILPEHGAGCHVVYISRTEDMRSDENAGVVKFVRGMKSDDPDSVFAASEPMRKDFIRRARTRLTVALPGASADPVKPSPAWDHSRNQAYYDAHGDNACEWVIGVSPPGFDASHHEALVYMKVHKVVGHGELVRLVLLGGTWHVKASETIEYDAE